MNKSVDFYIDLGTTNTLIYAKGRGFLLNEPSLLAIKQTLDGVQNLLAVGLRAKLMLGKNPLHSVVTRPLSEGVIVDFETTVKMLHTFLARIKSRIFWRRPRLIISLPFQVTKYERRAVEEVGYSLGASEIQLLSEPMAAALGAGVPVFQHKGHMVVDVGGGTTEVTILSLGDIVSAKALRIGGNSLDQDIINHLKNRYDILIGEATAEFVKMNIGAVFSKKLAPIRTLDIGGMDLKQGLPKKFSLNSEMIHSPTLHFADKIVKLIRQIFDDCPPELAGDISENGLLLVGGGSLLLGLTEYLSQQTGVQVKLADSPLLSVAKGGAMLVENHVLFDKLYAG